LVHAALKKRSLLDRNFWDSEKGMLGSLTIVIGYCQGHLPPLEWLFAELV
jgi:hypothetical protein